MKRSTHILKGGSTRGVSGLSQAIGEMTLGEIRTAIVGRDAKLERIRRRVQSAERQGEEPVYDENRLYELQEQAWEVFDATNERNLSRGKKALKKFDEMAAKFDPPLNLTDSSTSAPTNVPPYYKVVPQSGTSVEDLVAQMREEYGPAPIVGVTEDAVWVRSAVRNILSIPGVASKSGSRGLPSELRESTPPQNGDNGSNGSGGNGTKNGSPNGGTTTMPAKQQQAGMSTTTLLVGGSIIAAAGVAAFAMSGNGQSN